MVTAVNSSCRSFALCVMGVTLVGCGSNDADRALQAARDKALHADYLVVSDGRGRSLFSSQLTVIERGGRTLAWTLPREEFTLRTHRRCYERHTEFNRADIADARAALAPPQLHGASIRTDGSKRVLAVRESHDDFADSEYEVVVDASGRPLLERVRSAKNGVVPATAWRERRYAFVDRATFERLAGAPPQPRC